MRTLNQVYQKLPSVFVGSCITAKLKNISETPRIYVVTHFRVGSEFYLSLVNIYTGVTFNGVIPISSDFTSAKPVSIEDLKLLVGNYAIKYDIQHKGVPITSYFSDQSDIHVGCTIVHKHSNCEYVVVLLPGDKVAMINIQLGCLWNAPIAIKEVHESYPISKGQMIDILGGGNYLSDFYLKE